MERNKYAQDARREVKSEEPKENGKGRVQSVIYSDPGSILAEASEGGGGSVKKKRAPRGGRSMESTIISYLFTKSHCVERGRDESSWPRGKVGRATTGRRGEVVSVLCPTF